MLTPVWSLIWFIFHSGTRALSPVLTGVYPPPPPKKKAACTDQPKPQRSYGAFEVCSTQLQEAAAVGAAGDGGGWGSWLCECKRDLYEIGLLQHTE